MKTLKVKQLYFPTSQEAWEGINEAFISCDKSLFREGRGNKIGSGIAYAYNVVINIYNAWMDPEFDFGKNFNYRITKWTMLLNNYVDMNKLDLTRSKVRTQDTKKYYNYNIAFLFGNKHDNGKGCLLNATFARRLDLDIPIIYATLRSSEITKRLAFDLLLLQRLGQYVWGNDEKFMIQLSCNQMYCNSETLAMYTVHRDILKMKLTSNRWTDEVLKQVKYFKTCDPKDVKYKVFKRVLAVIQPESMGGVPPALLAKDLKLDYDDIDYPETCITYSQRQKYRKQLNKKSK